MFLRDYFYLVIIIIIMEAETIKQAEMKEKI